jgi:hypothetical protein
MRKRILLLTLILLIAFTGCNTAPKPTTLDGQARDDALAYSEPIADNLFAGLVAGDYATFAKDFDPAMAKAMDEKAFASLKQMFDSKIGAYQSREVVQVDRLQNIVIVTYKAKFENEDAVSVRVNLRDGTPPQVAGVWFDSPKLRQK